MAKLTYHRDAPDSPVLALEFRPWVKVADGPLVQLALPVGGTIAQSVLWFDLAITVNDAPMFYTRNLLQTFEEFRAADFEPLFSGEIERRGIGDMFPDSLISFQRHQFEDGDPHYSVHVNLNLARVYGVPSDEWRAEFSIDLLTADELRSFLQQLEQEFAAVHIGRAPRTDAVPIGFGTLPLARQLNARAYDVIAETWSDDPFEPPLNRAAFEAWRSKLPPQAHVLDIGCGHGEPIVRQLLEHGCQVTGIDLSEGMLSRARANFPSATFLNLTPAELELDAVFDGACSFFSLLHADPIELRVALDRVRRALKPGGHLLLVSVIPNVALRAEPVTTFLKQVVWQWDYSPEEMQAAVTEHDRFILVECTELEKEPTPAKPSSESIPEQNFQTSNPQEAPAPAPERPTPAAESPASAQDLMDSLQQSLAQPSWINAKPMTKFFTIIAQRPVE